MELPCLQSKGTGTAWPGSGGQLREEQERFSFWLTQ
jgi:hypothetical protein